MRVEVPIELEGKPAGAIEGGLLSLLLADVLYAWADPRIRYD